MAEKRFRLTKAQIERLVDGYGYCSATDYITVEGEPVRFMYREARRDSSDSGWRFFSGKESQAYADDPANISFYDVNTIANYDRQIIPLLDSPVGSVFERTAENGDFAPVTDWEPDDAG